MNVRALDLFCGGGGSSWGARAAGVEIVRGVDADPIAIAAYAKNFGEDKAVCLKMTRNTKLAALGDLGNINLLLASPECTNHTNARGSRPIDEGSRETARFVVNFAKKLKPRWVIIENVIQMRSWTGYERLLKDLQTMGYHTAQMVLDAQEFGVPQQRRRLFVICDLDREPPPSIPGHGKAPPTVELISRPSENWRSSPLERNGRAAATLERAERAISALQGRITLPHRLL